MILRPWPALVLLLALGNGACHAGGGLSPDQVMSESVARAMLSRFGYGATPASLAAAETQTPRQYLTHSLQEGSRLPRQISETIGQLPIAQPLDDLWARLGPGGSERVAANANINDKPPAPSTAAGNNDTENTDPRKALRQEEHNIGNAAVQARLLSMANTDNPGHEALLSFWLNHFSIFAPKGLNKLLAWDYAQTLERALPQDSFKALLRASFRHPAMQVYLDNTQSTAPDSIAARMAARSGKQLGINENLARELLELHTLGIDGGYTQQDVQALARIITGAGIYAPNMNERGLLRAGAIREGLFLFDPRRHDSGEKYFLGQYFPAGHGLDEIDRALDLMALHPATARHLALKLARRFLADEPPPPLVDAMSQAYLKSDGRLSEMLWPLIRDPAFAASLAQPTKFKEPIDYVLSVARAACGDRPIDNGRLLAATLLDMGEAPFMHTTPNGYSSREADWLSPAALAKRLRLAMNVAAGRSKLSGEAACPIDLAQLGRLVGPLSAQTEQARTSLPAREQAALLLAAPEFMRR